MRVVNDNLTGGVLICGQGVTGSDTHYAYEMYATSDTYSNGYNGESFSGSNFIGEVAGHLYQDSYVSSWHITQSKPSWWGPSNNANPQNLTWAELEDGTIVSRPIMGEGIELGGTKATGKHGNADSYNVTIGSKSYNVHIAEMGYKLKDGDTSRVTNSEFMEYVVNGVYANPSSWWSSSRNNCHAQPQQGDRAEEHENTDRYFAAPYYTGGNFSSPSWCEASFDSYGFDKMRVLNQSACTFFFIGAPSSYKPWATFSSNYGQRTSGFTLTDKVTYYSGETVSVTVKSGETMILDIPSHPKGSPIVLDNDAVGKLGYGAKTLSITLGGAGGSNSYTASVEIIPTALEVEGNPMEVDYKPTACKLVYSSVVADGANASWYVCNNANDPYAVWEKYEGDYHEFANENNNADKWAVAWRCVIDGSGSSGRSELKSQVAMAVV